MQGLSPSQERAMGLFRAGQNVLITGCPGSGKTHLVRAISQCNVCLTAMTACAAVQISSTAMTLHRALRIGLGEEPAEFYAKLARRNDAPYKAYRCLVVDEVSMLSAELFEKMLAIFDAVGTRPQLVFVGDFMQLPPVSDPRYCFESSRWPEVFPRENCVELTENFRQGTDELADILTAIRFQSITAAVEDALRARVSAPSVPGSVKLFARRDAARVHNESEFAKLTTGPIVTYKWIEAAERRGATNLGVLRRGVLAEQELFLRPGAHVLAIANTGTLYNGLQGTIVDPNIPTMRRDDTGETIAVGRYTWKKEDRDAPLTAAAISQVPLIHSWAITIHKSQGMTLNSVELAVDTSMFAAGQAYVALSRAKKLESIKLTKFSPIALRNVDPRAAEFYLKDTKG